MLENATKAKNNYFDDASHSIQQNKRPKKSLRRVKSRED